MTLLCPVSKRLINASVFQDLNYSRVYDFILFSAKEDILKNVGPQTLAHIDMYFYISKFAFLCIITLYNKRYS